MILRHMNYKGQAATEFVIAAAFVLVPLFLIIPLLGKYVDIRHAAIQHARFTAWEYTVWAGEDERIMAGIDPLQSAGKKSYGDTIDHGIDLFFTDIWARDYGTAMTDHDINPLWRDHRGTSLLLLEDVDSTVSKPPMHWPLGVIGTICRDLFQFLGDAISLFGQFLRLLNVHAQFDAVYNDGYFISEVNLEVRSLDQVLPTFALAKDTAEGGSDPLVFKAKAAVLTNNWNAGSSENANEESRGLIVTELLSPISKPINRIISTLNKDLDKIPLLEVKLPALPNFGYVKDDLIPFEHLEGNDKKLESKQGLYSYEKK